MKYEYWFANIKELSNKKKKDIRGKVQSAKELYYIEETKTTHLEITEKEYKAIKCSIGTWDLEQEYETMKKKGVRLVTVYDADYPKRLLHIGSVPYALYVKGKLPGEDVHSVAIVGARECSPYGATMAAEFAKELSKAGVQIISGMARGVDSAGQKGALLAGGETFAVLGNGVDICYPRENIELYMEIAEHGGVISEQPLGKKPLPQHFPARNRIISGLADAILVIEAKQKSGSLITADMALEQGKDVYALPGPVDSILSKGCNNLIRQGAGILLSPEELLEELGVFHKETRENLPKTTENEILLETKENILYSCLSLQPKNIGELAAETQMDVPELLNILVGLELRGYIREISKNYYVRTK